MGARILILLLTALLALPVTVVLPPVQASPQVQERAPRTLAAKKKPKKNKPKVKTVRQSVTQTFASAAGLTVFIGGTFAPYPSTINVTGFTNGVITDVNLTLNGVLHPFVDDIDLLLVPAHLPGQNAIAMSDVGGAYAGGLTLTLDDQAAAALPDSGPLVSGTFQPTNSGAGDPFPSQTPSGNSLLSVFNGSDPNGTWQLFVVGDFGFGGSGSISSWMLEITADADVQVKVKKTKKGKKGKGRH